MSPSAHPSTQTPPTKKASPSGGPAHHVLQTSPSNFKPMVSWYKTVLGLRPALENDVISFMTYDDEHHRVAVVAIPGLQPKPKNSVGVAHVAYSYPSLRDLLAAYRERREGGVSPAWSVNHGPTMSLYYTDPDGNAVETQYDTMDAEEANAYLAGEQFAKNPVGVDVDPEELCRRLDEGVSEKVLVERPDIGPRGFDSVPL